MRILFEPPVVDPRFSVTSSKIVKHVRPIITILTIKNQLKTHTKLSNFKLLYIGV